MKLGQHLSKTEFPPQYDVYIFHYPKNGIYNAPWEKKITTFCARQAVIQARRLCAARVYARIEIKKTYFDKRMDRRQNRTIKVYTTSHCRYKCWILKTLGRVYSLIQSVNPNP